MRYTEEPVMHRFMWIPGPEQGGFYHDMREYQTWNMPLSCQADKRGQWHSWNAYLCLPRQMTEKEWQRLMAFLELNRDAFVMPDDQPQPTGGPDAE